MIVGKSHAWLSCVSLAATVACGDRSPPALWPDAPPPTLAAPIGVDDGSFAANEPATPSVRVDGAEAEGEAEAAPAKPAASDSPEPATVTAPVKSNAADSPARDADIKAAGPR